MTQASASVEHLHSLQICHRDLKPENYVFQDSSSKDSEPVLKLVDFDSAVVQQPNTCCRQICGTLPFVAPEVYLSNSYDGFSADIWSLGIVLLEIACGTAVLERWFALPRPLNLNRGAEVAASLCRGFHNVECRRRVVHDCSLPEIRLLAVSLDRLLVQMMSVDASERWPAAATVDFLRATALRRRHREM